MLCKSTAPKGKSSGKRIKFAGAAKGSPFGRAAEQSEAERARLLALKAVFALSRCKLAFYTKGLSLFKQFAVFAGQMVELCGGICYTIL